MKNIVIGRYVPGKSFLYRLDPRTKIFALIILMIAAFLITSFTHMLIALGVIVLILLAGRIDIVRVYFGLRPLLFLLIFTFSFQIFFNRQGPEVFSGTLHYGPFTIAVALLLVFLFFKIRKRVKFTFIFFLATVAAIFAVFLYAPLGTMFATGSLTIHQRGLEMAFFIMVRLIIIVTLSTILTISTKPTDLNLGLEAALKPFKLIRVNTEELAMIIAISIRYIPTLLDEANKIMLAQASRGVDFSEGRFKDKVMQIISLLVPMFIISFRRSDELANAMEARSFEPGRARTRLHVLTWKRLDTVTLSFSIAVFTLVLVLRVVL